MVRRGRYGNLLRETHEKSMWRYELHAWRSAIELAMLLLEDAKTNGNSMEEVRAMYEAVPVDNIAGFEEDNVSHIANFLQKTPSQRPVFLRKHLKGWAPENRYVFFLVAIIACQRAKNLIELRDNFRTALAPGRGYRTTMAEVYAFGAEVANLFLDFTWPREVLDAAGIYCGEDEDVAEAEDD